MRTQSTRSAKASEITHGWIVVDAEGVVVGRLASFIAMRLRGKHRADFTPHVDTGDHVVVINADKVALHRQEADGQDLLPPHRPSGRHQGTRRGQDPRRQAS